MDMGETLKNHKLQSLVSFTLLLVAFLICWMVVPQAHADSPGVRCVLVLPAGEKAEPEALKRLDTVLKDAQWWFSCQMEAYGYGPKTFSLELDEKGKVVVHIAALQTALTAGAGTPQAVMQAASNSLESLGPVGGSATIVVYGGYYWLDRDRLKVQADVERESGSWQSFSAWDLYSVSPGGLNDPSLVSNLTDQNPLFPPFHTRVLRANTTDLARTVAERTSYAHAVFIHGLGHAFGLKHPPKPEQRISGDLMDGELWHAGGNFVPEAVNAWTALSPDDAAALNKNALFREHTLGPPSTRAPRAIGARGAQTAAVAISPRDFAPIEFTGTGFTIERLGRGEKSLSNRKYVWIDGPPEIEGFGYTRLAGAKLARINVIAKGPGRIYVATGEVWSPTLTEDGWQMVPSTLTYGESNFSRVWRLSIYYKDVKANSTTTVPQMGFAGTMVFGPARG